MKQAVRVYWGSSEPEYYLYENGRYVGFWSVYHQGQLPNEWLLVPGVPCELPIGGAQ